jgi:uncharacterized membrane protein YcaP (DUF421 family)
MNIPDFGSGLVEVAIRSALIYVLLIVGLRIAGRRDVGQLSIPDLVVLLVISNGVQNAMVGQNQTFAGGLAAAGAILVVSRASQLVAGRSSRARRILRGEPRILYAKGRMMAEIMAAEEITADELAAAFRAHGILNRDRVRLAVLEIDGSISVIEDDQEATGSRKGRRAGKLPRPEGSQLD